MDSLLINVTILPIYIVESGVKHILHP